MSQYIVLSKIKVRNANSIAGLTWGFPTITSLLGFTHALSRELLMQCENNVVLTGCAVISNSYKQHVYHDKNGIRFTQRKFGYTFKPQKKDGRQKDPSIIEEGKANFTLSLIIELEKPISLTTEQQWQLEEKINDICCQMRLAGGTVLDIEKVKLVSAGTAEEQQTMLRKVKRLVMPGFILLDRSDYLEEYYQELKQQKPSAQLLDAWLDFSALRYQAIAKRTDEEAPVDEKTPAKWQYHPKPRSGYLVPLMTGYKAIAPLYQPDEVLNTRLNPNDESTQSVCFVEAIHSVGEWKGAHSIKSIGDIIWRYHYDEQWYLCRQKSSKSTAAEQNETSASITEFTNLSETDALDFL